MQDLKITLIQTRLHWEDVEKNLAHFDKKIDEIKQETDVIVLPEMFTTGFTMKPELLAEPHEGEGLKWMQEKAKGKSCVMVGSISVKENQQYFNRLYWVRPDGSYEIYNKRHLFRMGNEHQHYAAGDQKIIIEYKGWKICPLVCYDMRFPVWSRNTRDNTYDVLLYVANWPEVRSYPWKQLLIARAIENQAFVVGVNRVGEDGNNFSHSGDSCVINPKGEAILSFPPQADCVETQALSFSYLEECRKAFPVLLDGDEFSLPTR
jgi:predicted amidohydrolase